MRTILFAAGQAGSVAYLRPLLERWLASKTAPDWRIALTKDCRDRLAARDAERYRVLRDEPKTIEDLELLLADWSPDLVVAATSRTAVEDIAFHYARARKLPVLRFFDTWYHYRERLSLTNGDFALPDKVLVIDACAVTEAEQAGVPRHLLTAVGHPAWEAIDILPTADRRDVMFVSQPVRRHFGETLGYTEDQVWRSLVEIARANPDRFRHIYFVPHPADDMAAPKQSDFVTVMRSSHDALRLVGTVVGMFSSFLVDAVLSGRHVVSFQPNAVGKDMNAWCRTDGVIPRVTNLQMLLSAMQSPKLAADELRAVLSRSCERVEEVLVGISVSRGRHS